MAWTEQGDGAHEQAEQAVASPEQGQSPQHGKGVDLRPAGIGGIVTDRHGLTGFKTLKAASHPRLDPLHPALGVSELEERDDDRIAADATDEGKTNQGG